MDSSPSPSTRIGNISIFTMDYTRITLWIGLLIHSIQSVTGRPELAIPTVSVSANLGAQQVLPCELNYPNNKPMSYMVEWKKSSVTNAILIKFENFPITVGAEQYKGRLQVVDKASLQISGISSKDEGWYECNVSFTDSDGKDVPSRSTWIYLTVNSPPEIVRSSTLRHELPKGNSITLFCEGRGQPEPTITWKKDDQILNTTSRVIVNGSEVTINNLRRDDGGIYSCTFTNIVGQRTQPIKLLVEGLPYIMTQPGNKTVVVGQRVIIPCDTESYPGKVTHTWFKDGRDVQTTNAYTVGRLKITDEGSLLIQATIETDRGWYKCRPTNRMGYDEASAYIDVMYRPKVLSMPSQVTWARGHLQQLDCPLDAHPPADRVTWDRDQIVLDEKGRVDILENGTLLVSNVTRADAGAYRCTPYNLIGPGISSKRVQVTVKDPPTFSVRPETVYVRKVNESVRMNCVATGTPTPSLMWRKERGAIRVKSSRVIEGPTYLEIRNLRKADHGKYECVAANTVATIVTVTELRVEKTTPHAPYNVTVQARVFDAYIRWEPGYNGGDKTIHYTLWFRAQGVMDWSTIAFQGPATSYELYSLRPDTQYQFKIMSRNRYGDGTFSEPTIARTLGYVKEMVTALPTDANGVTYYPNISENHGPRPPPPSNLSASVKNRDIILTWVPPRDSPVPIFSYRVQYRRGSGEWRQYRHIIPNRASSSVVLANMEYGRYSIRVFSYAVMAYSAPSNAVIVNLEDDEMVLPEALIGGIIGGILFLLVAVLLALVAIFHSRKKERKSKNKKFNDISYAKPDEMNGRPHQRQTQRDRWVSNGRGDVMTATSNHHHHHHNTTTTNDNNGNSNGIFLLPHTRELDTRASLILAEERNRDWQDGRAVTNGDHNNSSNNISKISNPERALNSSRYSNNALQTPHHPHSNHNQYGGASVSTTLSNNNNHNMSNNEVPLTDVQLEFERGHRRVNDNNSNNNNYNRSRSQPNSIRYRGQAEPQSSYHNKSGHFGDFDNRGGIPQHRNRSLPADYQRRVSVSTDNTHQNFSPSYSFLNQAHPSSTHQQHQQHPDQTSDKLPSQSYYPQSQPNDVINNQHHQPSSSSSSYYNRKPPTKPPISNLHNPSFQSEEDDDVFNNTISSHPAPPVPPPIPPHLPNSNSDSNPQSYHLPRHSSMIPSHQNPHNTTALASSSDFNPPMFGVEDISSVLDIPPSQQISQLHLQTSPSISAPHNNNSNNNHNLTPFSSLSRPSAFSPSSTNQPSSFSHPNTSFSHNDNSIQPQIQTPSFDPRQNTSLSQRRLPSDSDNSSSQRLPYTRDQLQDVVQRLRQQQQQQPPRLVDPNQRSRSHPLSSSNPRHNVSGFSEPLPPNRRHLYDSHDPRISTSHPNLPHHNQPHHHDHHHHHHHDQPYSNIRDTPDNPHNYYDRGRPLQRRSPVQSTYLPRNNNNNNNETKNNIDINPHLYPQQHPPPPPHPHEIYSNNNHNYDNSRPRALSEGTRAYPHPHPNSYTSPYPSYNPQSPYSNANNLNSSRSIPDITNHHHNHHYQNLPLYQTPQLSLLQKQPPSSTINRPQNYHDLQPLLPSNHQPPPFSTSLSSHPQPQNYKPTLQRGANDNNDELGLTHHPHPHYHHQNPHGAISNFNTNNSNPNSHHHHDSMMNNNPRWPTNGDHRQNILDSTAHSSGIGSRNTSQSTNSFHPRSHHNGDGTKVSMSLSSGLDPDISLDTTFTPSGPGSSRAGLDHTQNGNNHYHNNNHNNSNNNNNITIYPRDTSTDENYEFDSVNALERDIMADIRRYSRLSSVGTSAVLDKPGMGGGLPVYKPVRLPSDGDSNVTTLSSSTSPPKPPRYTGEEEDSNVRFERLREEFKQFRQHQQQHQHQHQDQYDSHHNHHNHHHPISKLPPGPPSQRLPMDSDML